MTILYSIHEPPTYANKQRGITLGACLCEDYDREKAIESAQEYYCNRAEEDGEYGEGERDAILVAYNKDTDAESVEEITLTWHAEKDDYDGGRFDYYSSRGCKHG